MFEHTNVNLAHQGRNILVILIPGLGFRDRDLVQDRRLNLDHLELADITAEFVQAFDRPWRHDLVQITFGDAKILFQDFRILTDVE